MFPRKYLNFFAANALNDHGLVRSRGEILEVLVRSAKNKVRAQGEQLSHS